MRFPHLSRRSPVSDFLPTLAIAVVVPLMLVATPPRVAHAQFNTNLLVNGDAESGPGSATGNTVASIPGFTATGNVTVVTYANSSGFPVASDPGPADRGAQFFAGGPSSAASSLSQTVSLAFASSVIDAGNATFNLSGFLGGFISQNDNAVVTVSFANAGSQAVGSSSSIGPVLAADRGNATGLLLRQTSGIIPIGARSATAVVTFTRTDGSYGDGYADNLSFSVVGPAAAAPEPSTLPLLGMGLTMGAGMAGSVKRRKARGKAKQAA